MDKKAVPLTVAGLSIVAIALNFALFRADAVSAMQESSRNQHSAQRKEPLPVDGLVTTATKHSTPESEAWTMQHMAQLYTHIQTFRKRHNGQYPTREKNKRLFTDMMAGYQDYGFSTWQEAMSWWRNPDVVQADMTVGMAEKSNMIAYRMPSVRPDEMPVGAGKLPGQRDVLAWTDIYFHRNIRLYQGDRTTTKPEGYYLVLWDDGQVEKVDYKQVRFLTNRRDDTFAEVFPGQAGVPQGADVSYDEYQKLVSQLKPGERIVK